MPKKTQKLTLTVQEAANLLGVTEKKMYKMLKANRFKVVPGVSPVRVSKAHFFRSTGLEDPEKVTD